MATAGCELVEKTINQKLITYLEENPDDCDVSFCVGPEKKVVKALKTILKASSPVLKSEFDGEWKDAVLNKEEILLPDFDSIAFQLFVKLVILDTWKIESMRNLKLSVTDVLNLITICRRFEFTSAAKNLEILLEEYLGSFTNFKNTDEFLQMSQANLRTLLSSDAIPTKEIDIFESVCRWAAFQCNKNDMKDTGENIRHILGDCLFQIRFPLLTSKEFTHAVVIGVKNLLTSDEICDIFTFIEMDENQKLNWNVSQFPFSTKTRSAACKTLCLIENFNIVENPPFICDGNSSGIFISCDRDILLLGLGFLGPIKDDAIYDVTVSFRSHGKSTFETDKITKRLAAPKGKIFYFMLDEPLALNKSEVEIFVDTLWIGFELKTAPSSKWKLCSNEKYTPSIQRIHDSITVLQNENTRFRIDWKSNQLCEIIYKNA